MTEKLDAPQQSCDDEASTVVAAIVGDADNVNSDRVLITMDPTTEIWRGGRSAMEDSEIPNWGSVIINDKLYIPDGDKIFVRRLRSNELIHEIAVGCGGEDICGTHVAYGGVFFYTEHDIYVLDSQGASCTKIAHLDENLGEGFTVVKYNANELAIALPIYSAREVHTVTFHRDRDPASPTHRAQRQELSRDMILIGSHEDVLYFHSVRPPGEPLDYLGYRGDDCINSGYIRNCYQLIHIYIGNGHLYVAYKVNDGNEITARFCGIDVQSNRTVFEKSFDEFGLQNIHYMIPVIRTRSNCHE